MFKHRGKAAYAEPVRHHCPAESVPEMHFHQKELGAWLAALCETTDKNQVLHHTNPLEPKLNSACWYITP